MNPCSISSSLSTTSVDPIDHVDSSAILGSSEFHCRYLYFPKFFISLHSSRNVVSSVSLISIDIPCSSKSSFTDIIQAREVEEVCSILVLVSESARKIIGKY